jgi:carboxyl-terminal processing protease
MEPLCRNLDFKPTHCAPISTKFIKSASLPCHSHRLLCLNRWRSKNRGGLMAPCAWHKPESETQRLSSRELMTSLGKGLFGFAAAAAAFASVCCDSPALAESLTVAFPVSRAREVIFFFFFFFSFCYYVL